MNLEESKFLDYVSARSSKSSFDYGGLTAVAKQMPCGGYSASVHDSDIEITLASVRKDVRRFGSIDSVSEFFKKAGITVFECMVNK